MRCNATRNADKFTHCIRNVDPDVKRVLKDSVGGEG